MKEPREVILEYQPVGRIMRVCAVDADTGTEVVIQGPIDASEEQLKRTAIAKLTYVLERRGRQAASSAPHKTAGPVRGHRT